MTTNAWDEKWSKWKPNHGVQPPHEMVEVKFDDGSTDQDKSEMYYWPIDNDSSCDIIAYRYKIKEPESDMHPDLEWLARNVSEWPLDGQGYIQKTLGGRICSSNKSMLSSHTEIFTKPQWLQARKDLGLIMSDAEEEIPAPEWAGVPEGVGVHDSVNKPKHYQLRDGYEVYDLRQDLAAKAANGGATYDQYSDWDRAIEYIIRMWGKNRLEDAKKGRWYLDKLIEKLEAQGD